ncbi:hypothetical protein Ciccas_007684 [Cichlidogyrus casuarinus]|uniref:Uncharacterized protein n=1 Tax=Cichlidogyrus casuarinus TaxID=1844966 RepID=A0ABD2Q282_9PLAT
MGMWPFGEAMEMGRLVGESELDSLEQVVLMNGNTARSLSNIETSAVLYRSELLFFLTVSGHCSTVPLLIVAMPYRVVDMAMFIVIGRTESIK